MAFKHLLVLTFALTAAAAAEEETVDGMAQMFAEMDTDKDGSLSLAEYIGLSDEEVHGMSPEELADVKLNFDKLDEDKSGKLSQAEMAKDMEDPPAPEENEMSAMEEGAEEQDMEQGMAGTEGDEAMDDKQMVQQMMEELDKGKDGFLSLEEFEGDAMDDVEEADKEEMKKGMQEDFRKADKNNDSKLSTEELQALGNEEASEEA